MVLKYFNEGLFMTPIYITSHKVHILECEVRVWTGCMTVVHIVIMHHYIDKYFLYSAREFINLTLCTILPSYHSR